MNFSFVKVLPLFGKFQFIFLENSLRIGHEIGHDQVILSLCKIFWNLFQANCLSNSFEICSCMIFRNFIQARFLSNSYDISSCMTFRHFF